MADEMDFLELVIASERVGRWLDVLHLATSRDRARCRMGPTKAAPHVAAAPCLSPPCLAWVVLWTPTSQRPLLICCVPCRCKVALLELADAVKSKPPYAEEVRKRSA